MGPEGAVNVLYRARSRPPRTPRPRRQKVAEFREKFANPYVAAERGFVDEVIEPRHTRRKLVAGASRCRATSATATPPRSTGTSLCRGWDERNVEC